MAIDLVIAVTDGDWFETLRRQPDLKEVNFWAPSPGKGRFRALEPGELFLFKLHAPQNFIVGGGVFAYANALPCSLAWEAFGVANGAQSLDEMRARIARYRRTDPADRGDFQIGCRILTQPFFLAERDWIPVPPSWAPNIVAFKTYSTTDAEGLGLWERVILQQPPTSPLGLAEPAAKFGAPQLVAPRLGQGAFRVVVTDLYRRRCAITKERTLPALEAAHIKPYSEGGEHRPDNGLLLRRDIHSLFDSGYVTVTPDHRFEVSRRIKEEYENGRHCYALHGQLIDLPDNSGERPSPSALALHNEYRFKG